MSTDPSSNAPPSSPNAAGSGRPLTVLGGGPAGLASGFYGRRHGLDVRLFEAGDAVGGNARTLTLGPFRYDTGAHRFHDKNAQVTADLRALLGDELRRVDAPSQICWRGRRIDFPLAPYDLLRKLPARLLAQIAWEQLSVVPRSGGGEPPHFEAMARASYGPTLARHFLLDYTEKLWGRPGSRLSPDVAGDRLEGLDLKTFFLEAVGGARGKARHLDGSFLYPERGYGRIAEATANALGRDRIRTGARVTRIAHDGERVTEVAINDAESVGVETVVSTLPLTLVMRLLDPPPPEPLRAEADGMAFRHLRLAVLGLDVPRVSPNASLYFPAPEVPFTRLYEPKNRGAKMAPSDQTVVVLELPCDPGDANWALDEDALREKACALLDAYDLADRGDVAAFDSHAVPFAYPVLEVGSRATADRLTGYLDRFDNLHLLGRSARFVYTHVHNLFAEARRLTARLA
jgi:protoporphyrinogen oxidase